MRRKTVLATLSIALVTLAVVGMQITSTASCETIVDGKPSLTVTINSPESKIYMESSVGVNFTIEGTPQYVDDFNGTVLDLFFWYGCELDYNTSRLTELVTKPSPSYGYSGHLPSNSAGAVISKSEKGYEGYANLSELSDGTHNITVWVRVEDYRISFSNYTGAAIQTVSFTIDTTSPTTTPSPSSFPTPSLTPSPTLEPTPSQSPTIEPTLEPTQTSNLTPSADANQTGDFTLSIVLAVLVVVIIAVVVAALAVYFRKRKRS